MCNPPFFESIEEKRVQISEITLNQAVYKEGGEVQFIKEYFEESYIYRRRIHFFSSLIGVKSHK
jgi:23S rRNA A1618 N6-methylase RlmF